MNGKFRKDVYTEWEHINIFMLIIISSIEWCDLENFNNLHNLRSIITDLCCDG